MPPATEGLPCVLVSRGVAGAGKLRKPFVADLTKCWDAYRYLCSLRDPRTGDPLYGLNGEVRAATRSC